MGLKNQRWNLCKLLKFWKFMCEELLQYVALFNKNWGWQRRDDAGLVGKRTRCGGWVAVRTVICGLRERQCEMPWVHWFLLINSWKFDPVTVANKRDGVKKILTWENIGEILTYFKGKSVWYDTYCNFLKWFQFFIIFIIKSNNIL